MLGTRLHLHHILAQESLNDPGRAHVPSVAVSEASAASTTPRQQNPSISEQTEEGVADSHPDDGDPGGAGQVARCGLLLPENHLPGGLDCSHCGSAKSHAGYIHSRVQNWQLGGTS